MESERAKLRLQKEVHYSAFIASQLPADSVSDVIDMLEFMDRPKQSYEELISLATTPVEVPYVPQEDLLLQKLDIQNGQALAEALKYQKFSWKVNNPTV